MTGRCPCGGASYAECCEPLHDGSSVARSAEQLMRSRYSAYAVGNLDYVFRTWHPRTRPHDLSESGLSWVALRIVDVVDGRHDDDAGIVEFVASFIDDGTPGELRERSRFTKRRDRWVYVDAE